MTPIHLKLTFEPLSGALTLLQICEDPPVQTGETQTFARTRRQQLTLTPQVRKQWPEFLTLLPQQYEHNCFVLDFHGPRAELNKLLAYFETVKDKLQLDITFRFCGREVDELNTVDYRRRRFRSINREIQNRKYPALANGELENQFQNLVHNRLDRILTQPQTSDWAALHELIRTAQNCLKEASKPADLFTNDLELVKRLQGYKKDRQKTVGEILERLESLGAAVRGCNWEPLWQECQQALADLTHNVCTEDRFMQFVGAWITRFEESIGGFGRMRNDEIQSLYRLNFWRRSTLLDESYPVFSAQSSAEPIAPCSSDGAIDRDHVRALLRSAFDQRVRLMDRERRAFLECNEKNIQILCNDRSITDKMLAAGEKQLKRLRKELDAENRQLLAAASVIEEVRILLAESIQ